MICDLVDDILWNCGTCDNRLGFRRGGILCFRGFRTHLRSVVGERRKLGAKRSYRQMPDLQPQLKVMTSLKIHESNPSWDTYPRTSGDITMHFTKIALSLNSCTCRTPGTGKPIFGSLLALNRPPLDPRTRYKYLSDTKNVTLRLVWYTEDRCAIRTNCSSTLRGSDQTLV